MTPTERTQTTLLATAVALGLNMHKRIFLTLLLLLAVPLCHAAAPGAQDYAVRLAQILKQTPLIDGHNDLPWEIRERFHSRVSAVNLASDTSLLPVEDGGIALMTDINRLRPEFIIAEIGLQMRERKRGKSQMQHHCACGGTDPQARGHLRG